MELAKEVDLIFSLLSFRQVQLIGTWRCIDVKATLYKRHVPAGDFSAIRDKSLQFKWVPTTYAFIK